MRVLTATCFAFVSVVRIALAASAPPLRLSRFTSVGIPRLRQAMGNGWPITPVDPTNTERGAVPTRLATRPAISFASVRPLAPVQALAFPLLIMIARPIPCRRWSRSRRTGAAATRFFVKTPAMDPSCSDTTSARSGTDAFLMPAWMPAARKPSGAVIPPLISFMTLRLGPASCGRCSARGGWSRIGSGSGQTHFFGKSQH